MIKMSNAFVNFNICNIKKFFTILSYKYIDCHLNLSIILLKF